VRLAISAYNTLRNLLSDNVETGVDTEFDGCCLGVSLLGVDLGDDDAPLGGDGCAGAVLTGGAIVCATAVAVSTIKIIDEDTNEF
jgi:hypothetical protein